MCAPLVCCVFYRLDHLRPLGFFCIVQPVKTQIRSRKDLGRFQCSEKVKRDSSLSSGSDDEVNKNWTAEAVIKFCDQLQASIEPVTDYKTVVESSSSWEYGSSDWG